MLIDIGKICKVKQVIKTPRSITKFIYNHMWVLPLMRKYIGCEILRPGVTYFAMNYITLNSLIEKKACVKCSPVPRGRKAYMPRVELKGVMSRAWSQASNFGSKLREL